MGARNSQRFVGKAIPAIILAFVFSLLGVLAINLIAHNRVLSEFDHAFDRVLLVAQWTTAIEDEMQNLEDAARTPGASQAELEAARTRLSATVAEFDEQVKRDPPATWSEVRREVLAARDAGDFRKPRVAINAMEVKVWDQGRDAMRGALRTQRFEGILDTVVLLLSSTGLLALLFSLRKREQRARQVDAALLDHLERVNADLDAFAGRIAHDLRTPLTPILVGSRMMSRPDLPADTAREVVGRIEHSARRLEERLSALLQFARLGGQPGTGEISRLNAVVGEVIASFGQEARVRQARLEPYLGEDAAIRCDPALLADVVQNLLQNAFEHGLASGIDRRIQVRTRREGQHGIIEIEDNGPGVPPSLRNRVFEPFFSAHPEGSGTGLGLAIARRIIEARSGHIQVEQGRLGGALFRIALPVIPGPTVTRPAVEDDALAVTSGRR